MGLSPAQLADASNLLWEHWTGGRRIDQIPESLRPSSRADGYAVQGTLEQRSGAPLFGWKIAATSTAGQKHINVDGPLAGRLLRERAFESGVTVPFGANHMRVAEAEFAFRMGRDLTPQWGPFSVSEVVEAAASLHPAIEIPDSRFDDFTIVGAAQLIADNACAHYFVLGDAAPESWHDLDLSAHAVRGEVAGKIERRGVGANVLGDPRIALAWLANELSSLGITLRAGQVVTTGTCLVPLEIAPGDHVRMDFGALGRVECVLSS
ncbi:MAG TPA: fumarylacetoacetate hydrolase family protein [Vicinamibacterales bacterium]|jgi:2-keto-4-pentenoate hydratase|nr:fumarylacetoacetate hydrolase family protein [Vicinamibacterales bacterium]